MCESATQQILYTETTTDNCKLYKCHKTNHPKRQQKLTVPGNLDFHELVIFYVSQI